MTAHSDTPAITQGKTFLGHPRGLVVLFFAEMWERFSYYGMRALLIFYLTWHFLFEREDALTLYGAYVAFVYLGPVLGGYLADKYIGARKAVTYGAILLVAGHGLMGLHGQPATETLSVDGVEVATFERPEGLVDTDKQIRTLIIDGQSYIVTKFEQPERGSSTREITYTDDNGATQQLTGEVGRVRSEAHEQILFLALALIIGGVGFLKGNISTCVGALYDQGDPRRDPGFTIYYMGINLGAFTASIACPLLAAAYGWSWGFGAAALGMLAGLVVFLLGQSWLEGRADPPNHVDLKSAAFAGVLNREGLVYLAGLGLVAFAYVMLQLATVNVPVGPYSFPSVELLMHVAFLLTSAGVLVFMLSKLDAVERDRMIGLLVLVISSIMFWTLFDQGPSSLNLFASAHVTNEVFGWQFPAAVLQSANPMFILIFAVPVAALWTALGARRKAPSAFVKFGFAMFQIGAGFFVLNFAIMTAGGPDASGDIRVSVIFIMLLYLLHTTGELFLSPVGLSSVTKLAVPTLVSFMMGFWFFATSYANVIAAIVAKATQVPEGAPAAESIALYNDVYMKLGIAAVALGLLLLVANPYLKKLTHGRD